jgi:hypothetical protein
MSIKLTLDILESCIIENNTVISTLTNSGYILYTLNMLKSLKPYGLDKKVFIVTIDKKSKDILSNLGYNVFCIENDSLAKFCPWNSKGYDKICYFKLELIYNILSLNLNILLVDGDIIFRQSPLEDIYKWVNNNNYDVWVQNDSINDKNTINMCTGYMLIKSSKKMIELYDCVSDEGKSKYLLCAYDNNDQTYFNNYVKPYCKFFALPLVNYPNGNIFYNNPENILKSAILIHFNWIHGHSKLVKMKEYKLWLLTSEEEEEFIF